jgi:hypothetical protein
MTLTLSRRFQRLESFVNDTNLKDYYGIVDTPERSVNVDAVQKNTETIFTISFKESIPMINIRCLPMDVICNIASYLNCYLTIKTKIVYPQDYPFSPPQWSLACVQHNIVSRLNLKEYYEYLVETHNNQYQVDWSPSIHVDKDILDFIRRINHFDYLIDCV